MMEKDNILKVFREIENAKEVGKTLYFIPEDICQKWDKENNNQTNKESEVNQ